MTADRRALAAQTVALLLYAGWVIWVGLHHEAWFDESQAWILARDNTLPRLVGHYARYEGAPGLWLSVLWFAVRAGLPFAAIWVLSAACAIGGAALVAWRAPFPLPLRLGLLASYYFGYQYSVIARGYCLDLLLLPVAALLFPDRVRRPLAYAVVVGVIANINAFSFLAAGLLGLELLVRLAQAGQWRRPQALAALAIAGALGLFSLWTGWQPADNGFMAQVTRMNPLASAVVYVANALFDRVTPWGAGHPGGGEVALGLLLSLVLLGLVVRLVLAGRDRVVMLAIPVAVVVFAGWALASSWHAGVLFVLIVFVLWTQWHNPIGSSARRALIVVLALLEVLQGVQMLRSGAIDLASNYSAGRPAAAGVMAWRAAHPGGTIAVFGGQAFETQPWLPYNVFANYHGGAPHPQFVEWPRAEPWHALPKPAEWRALLAARPDAILAARIWLPDGARAACYRVAQVYPAVMPWRGVAIDNSLVLFERSGC
jgi:hypothetical protein